MWFRVWCSVGSWGLCSGGVMCSLPWPLLISAEHWGNITSHEKSPHSWQGASQQPGTAGEHESRELLQWHRLACKNAVTSVFTILNSSFLYLVSILVILLQWWCDQQVCRCEWANYVWGEVFDSLICFPFIHLTVCTDCIWAPRVL